MTRAATAIDPFGPTANPSLYVPRPSTREALARVREFVDAGRRPVALVGPPGIGKTMLLRVLTLQLEDRYRMVFVPHPTLSTSDLCAWALSLLGEVPSADPERALVRRALQEQRDGSALLLVVDDADTMPINTARRLGELTRGSEGALRLLVSAADDVRAGRFLQALDPDGHGDEVRLTEPMNEQETVQYVRSRLEATKAPPAVRGRFDAGSLARLHRASGGNPRRLHEVASQILEAEFEEPIEAVSHAQPALRVVRPGAGAESIEEAVPAPEAPEPWTASPPDPLADPLPPVDAPSAAGPTPPEAAITPAPMARAEGPQAKAAPPAPPTDPGGESLVLSGPRFQPAGVRFIPPARGARRPIRRSAPPGLLVPLGVAALVAVAAVVIPLLTPRIVREMTPRPERPATTPLVVEEGRAGGPIASLPPRERLLDEPRDAPLGAAGPGAVTGPSSGELSLAEDAAAPIEPVAVSVNAVPWAEIEVDGIVVGVTPLANLPLVPGPHVVRARMPDGRTLERRVEIGPETRHLSFE